MKNLLLRISVVAILLAPLACSEVQTPEPTKVEVSANSTETIEPDATVVNGENARLAAAVSCQCVAYIRNRFSLQGYYGNAKDWNNNLVKAGYKVTAYPVYGDIIVFQPLFGGVDATYGHIAAVASYAYSYNTKTKVGTRTLKHRGANTGGSETDSGCNNVKTSTVTYTDTKVGYIAYYHK